MQEALTGVEKGPKNALLDGTRCEYDPILKRTVEITPSGERFPVTLDGKLQRDSQKADKGKGRPPSGKFRQWRGRRPSPRMRCLGLSYEQFAGGCSLEDIDPVLRRDGGVDECDIGARRACS
jgi:hypothetical protein